MVGAFRGMIGRLLPVRVRDGRPRPVDGELIPDSAIDLFGIGTRPLRDS